MQYLFAMLSAATAGGQPLPGPAWAFVFPIVQVIFAAGTCIAHIHIVCLNFDCIILSALYIVSLHCYLLSTLPAYIA